MAKESPQRSCLGCGNTKNKKDLLRFVLAPDQTVVPDIKQKLPGRGAYTCSSIECLRKAIARKQFSRAFKMDVRGVSDELVETLRTVYKEHILGYVALANKAGKLISGTDTVLECLKKQEKPALIMVSEDISEEIGEKVRSISATKKIPCYSIFLKEQLGDVLGKSPRSVVAFMQSGFINKILTELEIYRNFSDGGSH